MTGLTKPVKVWYRPDVPFRIWWALGTIFLSMFSAVVFSVVYANHIGHESEAKARQAIIDNNQAMCDLLVPIAKRQKQIPNPTDDQKAFLASLDRLIVKYQCKGA